MGQLFYVYLHIDAVVKKFVKRLICVALDLEFKNLKMIFECGRFEH